MIGLYKKDDSQDEYRLYCVEWEEHLSQWSEDKEGNPILGFNKKRVELCKWGTTITGNINDIEELIKMAEETTKKNQGTYKNGILTFKCGLDYYVEYNENYKGQLSENEIIELLNAHLKLQKE